MKIFIATKNGHKKREFTRILQPMGFEVITEGDLTTPLPEVEENGTTFEENSYTKAKAGLDFTGLITVADDSGICVDALGGRPGIYSARYSGENATDKSNNDKLLEELIDVPDDKRTAHYVCVITCVFPNGESFSVRGECNGTLTREPLCEEGFGYDPLFISEKGCFALIPPEEKDSISHRGIALRLFKEELKKYINRSILC